LDIGLSLSEINPVYFADRQYLSLVADGDRYCISANIWSGSMAAEITVCGKFAAVSCRISHLEKFAAENCGPYLWQQTKQDSKMILPY